MASLNRFAYGVAAVVLAGLLSATSAYWVSAGEKLPKAAEMFSPETQAFLYLPSSDQFLESSGKTELGKLAADERLKDFWESQQTSIRQRLGQAGWQLKIKLEDLSEICSGQAAMGWIARPAVAEKPFSVALLIDIVGNESKVDEVLQRIQKEMEREKAQLKTVSMGDARIQQYTLSTTPGSTTAQTACYVVNSGQLFAADDMATIEELLRAQKELPSQSLFNSPLYRQVQERIQRDDHAAELEYFLRPLGFGRLLRAVSGKQPRGQVDLLKLLEGQGFDSILCAAGSIQFNKQDLDMHHQGFILREEEVPTSVQILDFPNKDSLAPPPWVASESSSVLGISWNFRDAFLKFENIVNAFYNEDLFDATLEGIKMDINGPQIDIENEVVPYVGSEFYLITQIESPITPESKRSLICVRLQDPEEKLKDVLNRFSKQERGSTIEDIGDYRIWKFSNEEIQPESLDFDAGGGLDEKENGEEEGRKPLLENWAVTVIDDWFVFASNPDSLAEVIERANRRESHSSFEALPEVRACRAMQQKLLGESKLSFAEIDLAQRSFEMQYELFRQNILPQSRSLLALLAERLLKTDKKKQQQLKGGNLPPFQAVKEFFTPAGLVVRTEKDGWGIDSFILGKKKIAESADAPQ